MNALVLGLVLLAAQETQPTGGAAPPPASPGGGPGAAGNPAPAAPPRPRRLAKAYTADLCQALLAAGASPKHPACAGKKASSDLPLLLPEGTKKDVPALSGYQAAIVPDALAEVASLLYEVAVDRAKRDGLEMVRAQVRRAVCGLRLPVSIDTTSPPALPATCGVVTQAPLDQLASNPQPLIAALGEDALAAALASTRTALSGKAPVELAALQAGFEAARAALARRQPGFTADEGWILIAPLVQAATAADRALTVVKACAHLRAAKDEESCDVSAMLQLLDASGAAAIADGQLASLGISVLVSARNKGGAMEPDAQERFRQAVRFLFALAGKVSQPPDPKLIFARDLALAAIDQNVPRVVSLFASYLEANLPAGQRGPLHKVSAVLITAANYAATFESRTSKDPQGLRQARKEAIEGLIDATTVRTDRGGDALFSLGAPVGLSAGAQWIRGPGNSGPQGMWPQLAVPLEVALQWLPANDGGVGLHLGVLVVDLGQFAAYGPGGTLSRPRWDSIFAIGGQVGAMVGKPESSAVIGAELRYAPALFASSGDAVPKTAGAVRAGIFVAFYVPFFDFN